MPGISIHVVDVASGTVATGLEVALYRAADGPAGALSGLQAGQLIARGPISDKGLLEAAQLQARFAAGVYEAVFEVGAFYAGKVRRGETGPAPAVPFLDTVRYRFGIADPEQHYHLPFKMTAWGYSCFRGGA